MTNKIDFISLNLTYKMTQRITVGDLISNLKQLDLNSTVDSNWWKILQTKTGETSKLKKKKCEPKYLLAYKELLYYMSDGEVGYTQLSNDTKTDDKYETRRKDSVYEIVSEKFWYDLEELGYDPYIFPVTNKMLKLYERNRVNPKNKVWSIIDFNDMITKNVKNPEKFILE